jgi:hypothetical protein
MCWYFVLEVTAGNGAGFSPSPFSLTLPVIIPPVLSILTSLPPEVHSNALQEKLLCFYSLYSESECAYFSQYCSNGMKWNVICLVRKGGQERYQKASWYLFLASYTFSVNVIHTARFFIHYVFYILSILQLFISPCYHTFWYMSASFWRSLSLNPSLWPICAFGSCSIKRHLHFSYRLTVHTELNETRKLCFSYVLLSCKCNNKTQTNKQTNKQTVCFMWDHSV